MPSVKKLHLKEPRRFFLLLAVAECWSWHDALHELGYPDTNPTVYTGRVVADVKMQFIGSMIGLIIPTNLRGVDIEPMRIEEIKTHNKRMIERIGLKDWRDRFSFEGMEFVSEYNPNNLMDELSERGYAFEDKGFLTPLDYVPQKPVYDEVDMEVALNDHWFIRTFKSIAEDPDVPHTARLNALDKLAKIQGLYRQNKSAVDDDQDIAPAFLFANGTAADLEEES